MDVYMDDDLFELYSTGKNRKYTEVARNPELRSGFYRAVRTMMSVDSVNRLSAFSFLHYEHLKHQLGGLSSVRLSNRYVHRLIFEEIDGWVVIRLIEINNTHYGNKK